MKGIAYLFRSFPVYNTTVDYDSIGADNITYTMPKYPVYAICGATGNDEEMETKTCKYYLLRPS
jgi:hypothetical protein